MRTKHRETRTIEEVVAEALGISREPNATACVVTLPEAGGRCEREATRTVYGLPYCQRHGEECEAGALSNFWDDAHYALYRVDRLLDTLPPMFENPLAALIIQDAGEEAFRRVTADSEERHKAEQSVGIGGRDRGEPPGITRQAIDADEYMVMQETHYHVHRFMRLAHDLDLREVLEALESVRVASALGLRRAHTWTPKRLEA